MGLVYNHKNKLDLVVLSEEKLEKNEGEMCSFVILPDDDASREAEEKERADGKEQRPKGRPGE